MSKTVRYEVDLNNLPPLDDAFWKNAVRNRFYRDGHSASS